MILIWNSRNQERQNVASEFLISNLFQMEFFWRLNARRLPLSDLTDRIHG